MTTLRSSGIETTNPGSWIASLRGWVGGSFTPYVFISPFFILFAVFGLYPLLYALRLSFTRWHGVGAPEFVGLANYLFLLRDDFFWQSIGNSLYLWVAIVPAQTFFAIVVAAILSVDSLRFRAFFRTAFLAPYLVPLVAVAQIWLVMFDRDFGAVNTMLGLLGLPAIGWLTTSTWSKLTIAILAFWKSSGFAILIMLAALQGISEELYEAASIDGAGPIAQFFNITLPLMRRAIAFYVVIATLSVIQMFAEPYILTGGGPYNSTTTAGYALMRYIRNIDLGTGAANSFLLMLLLIGLSLFMLRLLRAGDDL